MEHKRKYRNAAERYSAYRHSEARVGMGAEGIYHKTTGRHHSSYREKPHMKGEGRHIGYRALAHKIYLNEKKAHPNYSRDRLEYIAHSKAGEIANQKRQRRGF